VPAAGEIGGAFGGGVRGRWAVKKAKRKDLPQRPLRGTEETEMAESGCIG
jgi:hypothetical protein